MEISKVKEGTYPAKITEIYITSEARVVFYLEIKVKRKKKVEAQVEYYLKKGKNKTLMKIIEDIGVVENGTVKLKRIFKCRFRVDVYYDEVFDVLQVTEMRIAKENDYLEEMENDYYEV